MGDRYHGVDASQGRRARTRYLRSASSGHRQGPIQTTREASAGHHPARQVR